MDDNMDKNDDISRVNHDHRLADGPAEVWWFTSLFTSRNKERYGREIAADMARTATQSDKLSYD
jgi:hypothetical protein